MPVATRIQDIALHISLKKETAYRSPVTTATDYRALKTESQEIGAISVETRTDREWVGTRGIARQVIKDRWLGNMTISGPSSYELLSALLPPALGKELPAPVAVGSGTDHWISEMDFGTDGYQIPSLTIVTKGGDIDRVLSGCVVSEWSLRGRTGQATAEFSATLEHSGKIATISEAGITGTLPALGSFKFLATAGMEFVIDGRDLISEGSINEWALTGRNELLADDSYPPGSPLQDPTNPLSGAVRTRLFGVLQTYTLELTTKLNSASQFLSNMISGTSASFRVKLIGPSIPGSPTVNYEVEISCPNMLRIGYETAVDNRLVTEVTRFEAGYATNIFGKGIDGAIAIRFRDVTTGKYLNVYQ